MLTDAQIVDVRRWAGYAMTGDGSVVLPSSVTLGQRLDILTAAEEEALTARYLVPLAAMEAAIVSAADNLDTKVAGPWTANDREVQQRTALYNKWRRDLCGFLGVAPGPSLGSGGITLVRG